VREVESRRFQLDRGQFHYGGCQELVRSVPEAETRTRYEKKGRLPLLPECGLTLSPRLRYGENSGDSMHAESHFRTSCHYQILPLNHFLSNDRVKRKDFPEIVRLP
jgi:hypothetical protein